MIKNFKIPLASYLELTKVIVAYSYFEPGDIIALNIVADKINKHPCAISRNNGFLTEIGLILTHSGNRKQKTITNECKRLGYAYDHEDDNQIASIWFNLIAKNYFLSEMITCIFKNSKNNKILKSDFMNYLQNSFNVDFSKGPDHAGLKCLVEILIVSGFIQKSPIVDEFIIKSNFNETNNCFEPDKSIIENPYNQTTIPITHVRDSIRITNNFKMPHCSYHELVKIIVAYSCFELGDSIYTDAICDICDLSKGVVSRNSTFLTGMGLLTTHWVNKSINGNCKKLGKAYEHKNLDVVSSIWYELIRKNSFLFEMLNNLNQNNQISKGDIQNYLKNTLNITFKKTGTALVGLNCLIDILKISGFLQDTFYNNVYCINLAPINNDFIETASDDTVSSKSVQEEYYLQEYICNSGKVAQLMIPKDINRSEIQVFYDVFNTYFKSRFKI